MDAEQVFSLYTVPAHGRTVAVDERLRFCPRCGGTLSAGRVAGVVRPVCQSCGSVQYRNPLPGVAVLIERRAEVLLGRRRQQSFRGDRWCLPGGFIEYGEDFLSAARREVAEETGLDVEIRSLLSVVSNFLAPEYHTLVVVLLARLARPGGRGSRARGGDDLAETHWFALGGPLPEMAFPGDRHIIERYRATRLQGAPVDPRFAGSAPARGAGGGPS
jgi:8-oxo-dGTP diphosphatase